MVVYLFLHGHFVDLRPLAENELGGWRSPNLIEDDSTVAKRNFKEYD